MIPLSEIFFLGIVLYLLYGFVFNFIIPVARTTKHVRQQFRNMQDPNMQNQANPFQQFNARNGGGQGSPNRGSQNEGYGTRTDGTQPQKTQKDSPKNSMGEYIDFEEIK